MHPVVPHSASILLIDDEPDMLDEVSSALSQTGYVCRCCQEPRAAVMMASQLKPDLIVSDINLGDASGLELCEEIKRVDGLANVPVIFLSGADTRRRQAISRGRRRLLLAKAIRSRSADRVGRQGSLDAAPGHALRQAATDRLSGPGRRAERIGGKDDARRRAKLVMTCQSVACFAGEIPRRSVSEAKAGIPLLAFRVSMSEQLTVTTRPRSRVGLTQIAASPHNDRVVFLMLAKGGCRGSAIA